MSTDDDAVEESDSAVTATLLDSDSYELGSPSSAMVTVEDDDVAAGPTARFASVPDEHDGTAFEVELAFSDQIEGIGYAWVRDTVVSATGARVTGTRRATSGSNVRWMLVVKPSSAWSAATLSVGAGLDLPDGRRLSAGDSVTVLGQLSLSAADAAAAEGLTAAFAVTLGRAAAVSVTVDYATTDGTAAAGSDYTAASGTLTFAPGETANTVSVALLDDDAEEDAETFTLTLANPDGESARLKDATATGTIHDDDAAADPPVADTPQRSAFFGDLHIHTMYSYDAYRLGSERNTPDDAYRYAKGEPIIHRTGRLVRPSGPPLDFLAVTDHAEYLGVDATGRRGVCEGKSRRNSDACRAVMGAAWQREIEAAERHNDPGTFTALIGYEYGPSWPVWLHRNVIYKSANVPTNPFSWWDSLNPRLLWDWLDEHRAEGRDALAIPHNMNFSGGQGFKRETWVGEPMNAAFAEQRVRNEPLVEVIQHKGTTEVHPLLAPNDEWADFQIVSKGSKGVSTLRGEYWRGALNTGLELEEELGVNPFRLGVVGGSDSHWAAAAYEEDAYITNRSTTSQERRDLRSLNGSGGLTGIWAAENTRAELFEGLRRRETFGTSGPRIRVRLFGGFELARRLAEGNDDIATGYAHGVPMGGVLRNPSGEAPSLLVWALRDPRSGRLQRLQIVKGWLEDGESRERVIDVACSDGLTPDPESGRCPDNGAKVDLADCSVSDDKGDDEIRTVWTDPDFDAAQRSYYYVRVLENPSCHWSTWDAVRLGVEPNGVQAPTLQERAWSSPIWVESGVPPSAPVTDNDEGVLPTPTAAGAPQVGAELQASFEGAAPADAEYQWLRGDVEIAGATGMSYSPTAADVGYPLSVRVSSDGRTVRSAATVPIWPVPGNPALVANEEELLGTVLTLASTNAYPLHFAGYGRFTLASFGSVNNATLEMDGAAHELIGAGVNSVGQFFLLVTPDLSHAAVVTAYWNGYRIGPLEAEKSSEGPVWTALTPQPSAEYARYWNGASDGVLVALSIRRPAPAPTVTVTALSETVAEGASASFEVTLSRATGGALTVSLEVLEEGAVLSGSAPPAVTIPAGESLATLELATEDDAVVEDSGSLTVTLVAGEHYEVGAPSTATLAVEDDDEATFTVTGDPAEIVEGGSATVTVAIDNGTTFAEEREITLSVSGGVGETDYTLDPASLTLAAGSSSVSASFAATEDEEDEERETALVAALLGGVEVGAAEMAIRLPSTDATLSGLELTDAEIGEFDSGTTAYAAEVAYEVDATTVEATPGDAGASVEIVDAVGSTLGSRRTTRLVKGENEIAATVTAEDGETTRTYTVTVTRESTPAWGTRRPDRDIALAGMMEPAGVWSDGTTLWASDYVGGRLRAFDLATGGRRGSRDINASAAVVPSALWSDQSTLWVADHLGSVRGYRLLDGSAACGRGSGPGAVGGGQRRAGWVVVGRRDAAGGGFERRARVRVRG